MCGIQMNGKLYCWGDNEFGQIGDGTEEDDSLTPMQVGESTNWSSLAAGEYHTCAINLDQKLFCWGRNNKGQIGSGDPGPDKTQPLPVQVFRINSP